jgi:hypothetical protein
MICSVVPLAESFCDDFNIPYFLSNFGVLVATVKRLKGILIPLLQADAHLVLTASL